MSMFFWKIWKILGENGWKLDRRPKIPVMENGWFLPVEKWMETRWNMLKFKRDFVREYDIDPESSPHNRPASCKNWHGPWYSSYIYIYMVVPTIYIKPIHPSQSRIKHIHTQKKSSKQEAHIFTFTLCLSRFWMSSSGLGSTPSEFQSIQTWFRFYGYQWWLLMMIYG